MLTMGDDPYILFKNHSIYHSVFNNTISWSDLIRLNIMRRAVLEEFSGFFQEPSHDVANESWTEESRFGEDDEYEEYEEEDNESTSFPLHHLCADLKNRERRPIRIKQIQTLIEINSTCLLIQDKRGRTPLNHLMNNSTLNDPRCFQLFEHMILLQPSSVTVRSKNGYTTLHYAVRNRLPSRVVLALIRSEPRLVSMRDYWGDLPLHIACRHFCNNVSSRGSPKLLLT
jgi:hypothetical protein